MADVELNSGQAIQLLEKSLEFGLYEAPGNKPPEDKDRCLQDANTIASLVHRAIKAGNESEKIKELLSIIENGNGDDSENLDNEIKSAWQEVEQESQVQGTEEGEAEAQDSPPETEDAGTFARVQTSEAVAEERGNTKAKPVEKDGERDELNKKLKELSNPIKTVEAHGVSFAKLEKIPIDKLRYIIENPDGPTEEPAVSKPTDRVNAIAGMDMDVVAPPVEVTKETLGIELDAPTSSGISSDREKLEAQVTGPMLKAYGRGRKEVPDIGDFELAVMVQNPTAQITPDKLAKARLLDNTGPSPLPPATPAINPEKLVETPPPEPEPAEEQITEAAQRIVAERQVEKFDEVVAEKTPAAADKENEWLKIGDESFPVHPEIEGNAPFLPNDVSTCDKMELFSYHARFHACEARINYIISNLEDSMGDTTKLKKARENTVASELPPEVNGKKVTNEFRDSLVAVDPDVIKLAAQEHNEFKIVRKMKVLRDNYHRDCERLSRQMAKWEMEKNDAPR